MAGLWVNNNSSVSKPFIVSAVTLVFAGSLIGSVWMMSLFGVQIGGAQSQIAFPLHRTLQIDGFLTVLIMGIGYMIVPRFRNSALPSKSLAYVSLAFALASLVLSIISTLSQSGGNSIRALSSTTRLAGVGIFAGMVFWMLRIRPRLLGLADYFIGLSVVTLLVLVITDLSGIGAAASALSEVQLLLLFPLLMIFGIEYKTMPSFLGFIRPRKNTGAVSFALAAAAVALGTSSAFYNSVPSLSLAFNMALVGCAATFAHSLYFFGGFDDNQIIKLISGEKKARYSYTKAYSRISFLFLYAGIVLAVLFNMLVSSSSLTTPSEANIGNLSYLAYDLAIHLTAIGFIGTTIALYLPLMLPAITGRQVHFAKFSHTPVVLLIAGLAVRAAGDVAFSSGFQMLHQPPLSYLIMSSGWMIVSALATFVVMVRMSMKGGSAATEAGANNKVGANIA